MDTRFSIAIHLLMLISVSEEPLSSARLAESVGTNPSFVRKVLASLKHAGLIHSHRGITGFSPARPATDITLRQVHEALYSTGRVELFPIHKNPDDKCEVGRHIQPTLDSVFGTLAQGVEDTKATTTIAQCIESMESIAGHRLCR